ncbi:hypothetical protein [Streptosporangium sp. NPDC004631]
MRAGLEAVVPAAEDGHSGDRAGAGDVYRSRTACHAVIGTGVSAEAGAGAGRGGLGVPGAPGV